MKKIKAFLVSIALLGSVCLAGCATTQVLPPGGQTTEAVITACTTFSTALKAITPLKPKMASGNINTVNASIRLTSPICNNPAAYNSNGAIAAIQNETANLSIILKGGTP